VSSSEERVVLISGASRGIGAATAVRLARDGMTVAVNYLRSADQAATVVDAIRKAGGTAAAFCADVSRLEGARELVAQVRQCFGRLDVLINNAGRVDEGLLMLTSNESWWSVFDDNIRCVVNMTRAALPLLLTAPNAVIVNMSSISGIRGTAGLTAYSSAKAAVIGFTKALSREVARKITVNCVAPGPVDTDMYGSISDAQRKARTDLLPLRRMGRPEEIAEIVALLARGTAGFLHGQVIAVDGGATT
jgi:3-oxoacyl-[acyl-carrier protein] reductase